MTRTREYHGKAQGEGWSYFESKPRRFPIRSKVVHPQLRDLLICPARGKLQSIGAWARSIDAHDLDARSTDRISGLSFAGNCLVSGCGFIAVGGEHSELYLRAADPAKKWALHLNVGRSIVNSATFWRPEGSSTTQFFVCNNDYSISRYVISSFADIQAAAEGSLSVDPEHHPPPSTARRPQGRSSPLLFSTDSATSPLGSTSVGRSDPPLLTKIDQIHLPVPVNHCSVSPSGDHLVAVGDSNEVFLYANGAAPGPSGTRSASAASTAAPAWTRIAVFRMPEVPSGVGSFHTSWRQRGAGTEFAVASEEGVVAIWDVRGGTQARWSQGMEPVLTLRTTQKGREGAARTVKYAPAGPSELLAFSEQQRFVHVLDARTLDPSNVEKLTVPHPTFSRPRPGPSRAASNPSTTNPSTRPGRTADTSTMLPWRGTSGWVDAMQRNVARYITNHVGARQAAPVRTASSEAVEGPDAEPCPELDPALAASSTPAIVEEGRPEEDDYESALRSFMRDDLPATTSPEFSTLLNLPPSLRTSTLMNYLAGAESWEDIIGMAWSPDGERLCAATEDSVVEWRVDGSVRRGFGDKGLL